METVSDLRAALARLERARDPADRDRLARMIMSAAPRVLRSVRVAAARQATTTMPAAAYARTIGITPGAVDHLLHR